MENKAYIIFIIVFLLCCISAAAYNTDSWILTDGNIDFTFDEAMGFDYSAYSMNYPNQIDAGPTDFKKCDLGASSDIYAPFVISATGDTIPSIWLISGTTLNIFDMNCNIIQTILLGYTPIAGGIQTSPMCQLNASRGCVLIASSNRVYEYGYDSTLNQIILRKNLTGTLNMSFSSISCPMRFINFEKNCILTYNATNSTINMSLVDGSYTIQSKVMTMPAHTWGNHVINSVTYLSAGAAVPIVKYPFCGMTGGNFYDCMMLDKSGGADFTSSLLGYSVPAGTNSRPHTRYSFVAMFGSAYKFFDSASFRNLNGGTDTNYFRAGIADIVTDAHYYEVDGTYGGDSANTDVLLGSNWVVGDYDMDGDNDACILYNRASNNQYRILCLDSTYHAILNLTEPQSNMTNNMMVMGHFIKNLSTLSFATKEGIFYYDSSSGTMLKWFDSGSSGTGFGQVAIGGQGSPYYIYTSDSESFLVRIISEIATCGDGTCNLGYENIFSCPADCLSNETSENYSMGEAPTGTYVGLGVNSLLCESGYVEYGKCALMPGGHGCTINSQCLSSVCANGKCNSASLWATLNSGVTANVGADSSSLMILSLVIIIAVMGVILVVSRGSFPGVILACFLAFSLTIGLTAVGWLPVYILLGGILIIVGLIIFVISIGQGSG
jgi:hypothetical protein